MKIVIYGASGHGKVVADIVSAMAEMELVGFVDDYVVEQKKTVGRFPVLGGEEALSEILRTGIEGAVVAIGRNDVRLKKSDMLERMGFRLVTAIHPSAILAGDVQVGAGTVIMAGTVVNASARIGCHVILNTSATVDHDCILEDGCHLSPGVHLAGHVSIGKGTHVGIGTCVIQNVRIGEWSTVGAGAVVIRNVASGKTVAGNPARELRKHA
jgi:acetyltransferase EpsM